MKRLRVVLADDSVLFREGLARVLAEAGIEVAGQAGTPEELLEMVRRDPPDVAVVDVRMPPTHTTEGLRAAVELCRENPGLGVLVLSHYVETQHVRLLIGDGGNGVGYLLKDRVSDLDAFLDAIRTVAAGRSVVDPEVIARLLGPGGAGARLRELSEREREVLALMAEGRSNLAIGRRLHLSAKTVEAHVHSIFNKLELEPGADDHRRVLAVLAYLRA